MNKFFFKKNLILFLIFLISFVFCQNNNSNGNSYGNINNNNSNNGNGNGIGNNKISISIISSSSTTVTSYSSIKAVNNDDDEIPDSNLDDDWTNWKSQYNKNYKNNGSEEKVRRLKWENNIRIIKKHNDDYAAGKYTYKLAINDFGDMDNNEYRQFLLTIPIVRFIDPTPAINSITSTTTITTSTSTTTTSTSTTTTSTSTTTTSTSKNTTSTKPTTNKITTKTITTTKPATTTKKTTTKPTTTTTTMPLNVDWRTRGYITPVKDQKGCGACWAFSAVAAIEAANYVKTGKLVTFSEQQLIDCASSYGNYGCNGGWMANAFKYVIANKGINTDNFYPYEEYDGTCRYNSSNIVGNVSRIVYLPSNNETTLTRELNKIPAISAGMNADLDSFRFYSSGVYNDPFCDQSYINHGVTVVGYGTESIGGDYYIVKNSWGTNWGENGYIRISRNNGNVCGIATYPHYPIA